MWVRRGSVALAAVVVVACGGAGTPDEPATPHTIAFLRAAPGSPGSVDLFRSELDDAGLEPGRDVTLLGIADDEVYPDADSAGAVIDDWADDSVDVVVAMSSDGALLAAERLPDAYVVFLSAEPESVGLVAEEQRPEGRLTGVAYRTPPDRLLDLAGRAIGDLGTVGVVITDDDPVSAAHLGSIRAVSDPDLVVLDASFTSEGDVGDAVDELASGGAQVILPALGPAIARAHGALVRAAQAHGIPVVTSSPVDEGALLSLWPDTDALMRQLARQTARLVSGSVPADVPVEDPMQFGLRLRTDVAERLGIEFDQDLLREATEVVP